MARDAVWPSSWKIVVVFLGESQTESAIDYFFRTKKFRSFFTQANKFWQSGRRSPCSKYTLYVLCATNNMTFAPIDRDIKVIRDCFKLFFFYQCKNFRQRTFNKSSITKTIFLPDSGKKTYQKAYRTFTQIRPPMWQAGADKVLMLSASPVT